MPLVQLVDVRVRIASVKVVVSSSVVAIIINVVVHDLGRLPALLTAENQEQDDEAEQGGERDTHRRQGSSPPRRVVDVTAVDDAVAQRHQRSIVPTDLRVRDVSGPTTVKQVAE